MEKAIISLQRKSAWVDAFRAYHIILDGKRVGTIRQGKSISFEVLPGHHEIFLTISWCSSRHLSMTLAPNARACFICQGRDAASALQNTFFGANRYIEFYQESRQSDVIG